MITKLLWNYKTKYNYYLVDTIPSTNTYLKDSYDVYPDKTVLIALEQTNGRGRYDRVWRSDGDIMFSILLKKNANYAIITPLAITIALSKLGFKTGIKWPNDIYMNDKKLGGILIEDIFSNSFLASVIGIGINMTDKPSVYGVGLNTNLDKFKIINEIMVEFDRLLGMPHNELIDLYKSNSIVIGKMVYYHDVTYKVSGIDEVGHLILTNDNETITVTCDEINIKESLL